MRKVLLMLAGVCAMALAATSLASGATTAKCGTLYTPKCTKPTIHERPLPPRCDRTRTLTLPPIHAHAIAGIKKLEVTLGSKVLYEKTFKGNNTQNYTIKHLKFSTKGVSPGVHTIKEKVTDVNGRTATHTEGFRVCQPPKFTG